MPVYEAFPFTFAGKNCDALKKVGRGTDDATRLYLEHLDRDFNTNRELLNAFQAYLACGVEGKDGWVVFPDGSAYDVYERRPTDSDPEFGLLDKFRLASNEI